MFSSGLVFFNLLFQIYLSQVWFYGNYSAGPYKISDNPIFIGTDSVFVGDVLVDREKYAIDYNQSLVTFKEIIADSILVIVKFRPIPFSIQEKYYQQVVVKADSADLTISEQKIITDSISRIREGDLEMIGSKTISVDLSSKQGLGLGQATRIDIKGNLQGVNVWAMLSDAGNPIPAEGTTKELAEFDKIQIKVQAEKFIGYYGDNDYVQSLGNIGTINKKLTGVLFDLNFGNNTTNLGYAKSKGVYKKTGFYGQNNKQGPYYLTKDMNNAPIVPGTENVYLNAKRLVRGQNEDYTVDYASGSITFTNQNIINSFSRIEIDFEYATEEYNRYLILANHEWKLNRNFSMKIGALSENDDKFRNLSYDLSPSDIESLSLVSSESSRVWLSGVKFVGAGNGDYILENNYFVFAGIDSGDYDIRFSYVGANLGDYEYDNSIAGFRYAGVNQGKYVSRVLVQLPEQNRIYNADFKWQTPFGINIDLQGFWSQRKQNLFSENGFNNGLAYNITTSYEKEKYNIRYQRREIEKRFYFPYAGDETDFTYNWQGIRPESLKQKDQLDFEIRPFDFMLLSGGAGWLNTFIHSKYEQYFYGGKFFTRQEYSVLEWKITHYPQTENRYYLNLTPRYKIFYPGFEVFFQDQKDSSHRYLKPSLRIKYNEEIDFRIEADFKETRQPVVKEHQVYKIQASLNKNIISLNSIAGYQINRSDNILENGAWFANIFSRIKPMPGLDITADYLQQQSEMQTVELNYLWVGTGLGNYKQNPETNQYYYDPNGDYVQQMIPSGNFVINDFRKLQANWDFYKWPLVNFDGYYALDFENRGQASLQNTRTNRFLNFSVLPFQKSFSVKITNYGDYAKDDQFLAYAAIRTINNNRIEMNIQKIDQIPLVVSYEHNNQLIEKTDQGIDQKRQDQIFSIKPKIGFNLDFEVLLIYARALISKPLNYSQLGEFKLNKWELAVDKNWQIDKWSNLNTNFSAAFRSALIAQLPYDLNLNEPKGITPQIRISFDRIFDSASFNQVLLNAYYAFLKYPDRKPEHNFSTKLQVNF
ncbi:MAG: hypothetical protein KGZ86_07170 [Candidatus Latescibacteria bacterium]|nr:hypothetical protein [Candidatus Latescibacterota bacterium]